jgi:hypothetical protein
MYRPRPTIPLQAPVKLEKMENPALTKRTVRPRGFVIGSAALRAAGDASMRYPVTSD